MRHGSQALHRLTNQRFIVDDKVGAEPLHYHPILLSGMGIMIGELLRLDEVSAECQRQNRWSFFISSQPLAIAGGIASPCNAVGIF